VEIKIEDTKVLTMAEIMPPTAANFSGHVHGGYLMMLLDRVAYACSSRYSKKYMVTLSFDQVLFKKPIFVGELVTFLASVNFVGTSSMEIGIKVIAENLTTGDTRHTNTCYVSMVAVDKDGKPTKVTPLPLETEIERYRFEEAKLRKAERMDYNAQHAKHKAAVRKS
jgi:acyl-CoA hydrolase